MPFEIVKYALMFDETGSEIAIQCPTQMKVWELLERYPEYKFRFWQFDMVDLRQPNADWDPEHDRGDF